MDLVDLAHDREGWRALQNVVRTFRNKMWGIS